MNSLSRNTEWLSEEIERMHEYLNIEIERNIVKRIIFLLRHLKHISKNEIDEISIRDLFEKSYSNTEFGFKKRGIDVPKLERFWSTKLKMNQWALREVVYSIMMNLSHYSKMGTSIVMKEHSTNNSFGIKISNIGLSISSDLNADLTSPSIFDRQRRGWRARETVPNKPGLGLAYILYISDVLGFDIKYEVKNFDSNSENVKLWCWHSIYLNFKSCNVKNIQLR